MPSEKSRYLSRKHSPTAEFSREETLSLLEAQGSRALAEQIWSLSEINSSLRYRLAVSVLQSRIASSALNREQVDAFLDQLLGLCDFEAEWKDYTADSSWAQFLAEIIVALELLLKRVPLETMRSQILEITRRAEESAWQIDDCYQCGLEIERMEALLGTV